MPHIKSCPICGETPGTPHLCGGIPTIIHTCINKIEITVRADTKSDVIRKWNAFATVIDR